MNHKPTIGAERKHQPDERRGLDIRLSDHLRGIEAKCRQMVESAQLDTARVLVATWVEMEPELLAHMAAVEDVILPAYSEHAPEDARRIRDDHARIRTMLPKIGADLEVHDLGNLRKLGEALEEHSNGEEASMYPWAVANIELVSERLLFARINHSLARN